ncbi:MAG: hypothetical protein ACRYFS_00510 [Janthinobacterium lividum]
MSVRRFVGYFIALSACATTAFASSLLDRAPEQAAQSYATSSFMPSMPPLSYYAPPMPPHKIGLKHFQVALAQ